ncbi:MAG: hypothetical protein H0X37_00050 [Herpetosiphonaceae bacterium]|nr:hypothetical protein [Herpetosiphonaceae bacterium]
MDNLDRLYSLLPVVDRQRDAERGWPLRALLQVISEQVNVVEQDISQLYDNWFIETCQEWVVPYIGDVVGYRPVHEAGEPGDTTTLESRERNRILIPRREVANTIHYRRRKGTLSLLESLAREVAGWQAVHAVEFYSLLALMQNLNAHQADRGRSVNLRDSAALHRLGGAFDSSAHTVDVRRPASHRTAGRYNIASIGLFVWRLKVYSVTRMATYLLEEAGDNNFFTFSVLGNAAPLYTKPLPADSLLQQATEIGLPIPISRRAFAEHPADYYGEGKSFAIYAPDWPQPNAPQPIPVTAIIPSDLNARLRSDPTTRLRSDPTAWHYHPSRSSNEVAVDPELGRIAFPANQKPPKGVWVTYHYGASAPIGGGEYERLLTQHSEAKVYRVHGGGSALHAAVEQWRAEKPQHAVIEINDSAVYEKQLPHINLRKHHSLQIRATQAKRPILRLLDYESNQPDALHVQCAPASCFTLDGLLIFVRGVEISGPHTEDENQPPQPESDPAQIMIRHTTLVPGWSLQQDCEPCYGEEASLLLTAFNGRVTIEQSILGSIVVDQDGAEFDPIPIHISDSVLDAAQAGDDAVGGVEEQEPAHVVVTMHRTTVLGLVQVREIALAENCIFNDQVNVRRRQHGCLRFCYVPLGSRTPRRYSCQPEGAQQAAEDGLREAVDNTIEQPTPAEITTARQAAAERVQPQWNSTRYGSPAYCQLADSCADEIKRGADDEAELGVFHDLFQAQRESNLRARLGEYTPANAEVSIIFAN